MIFRSIRLASLAGALLLVASCRTAAPVGNEAPVSALTTSSPRMAFDELRARRAAFKGARSLMRMHASAGGHSQSFRAQLLLDADGRMQLDAYTPIGTTALTLYADRGHVIFLNHLQRTAWEGPPADLQKTFGFLGSDPSSIGLLLIGLPPSDDSIGYDVSSTGLARATLGGVVVTYEPPSYPPHDVTVERSGQRLEITHLELVSTDAKITPPTIPAGYDCCVPPRL